MKSTERNKKIYEYLIEFTNGDIDVSKLANGVIESKEPESLDEAEIFTKAFNEMKERFDYLFILQNLKYTEIIRYKDKENKEHSITSITENGWKFIESYENQSNVEAMGKTTVRLTWILAISSGIAAVYYIIQILMKCPCN